MKIDFAALANKPAVSIFLYSTHEAYLPYKIDQLISLLSQDKAAEVLWVDQNTFLSDSSILQNQGNLFAQSVSQKLIIIQDATDKCAKAIEANLLSPCRGVRIIIPALVGASVRKIKTLHEKASNGAFVSCYLSQSKEKLAFLEEMMNRHNIRLNREAQLFALQRLDADLESVISAFSKLDFYFEDKSAAVSIAELEACISDFSEANIQPLVTNIGDRNLPSTLKAYHTAKIQGLEEIYILRALISHFGKLLALQNMIADGMGVEQAMQAMRPPIFFKQENEFKRHVIRWDKEEIVGLIDKFNSIELKIKTGYPYDSVQLWKPVFSECRVNTNPQ